MRTRIALLVVMVQLAGMAAGALAADQYAIDPVHTSVGFTVPHLVISRVHGAFTAVEGTILYDAEDLTRSSVRVTIQAQSVNTANARRDEHLRSPDFFDAAAHPEITFESTRIEPQGDGYVCRGTLTIRGVSKAVAIPFKVLGQVVDPMGKTRIAVEGALTINRQAFGVSWNKTLDNGGFVVGDEVQITLNVEAIRQAEGVTP